MTNPNDNYVFDATQHAPDTKQEPFPAGTYDVVVEDTDIVDIKDNKGWLLKVTFKVTSGEYAGRKFTNQYNLGHLESVETVRIAHAQLSSLSHVTGRMKVTKANKGAELRGAALRAQVTNNGEYNNLKAVFDTNGNPAGKAGSGYAPAATVPVASATPTGAWGATPAAAPVAVVAPVAAPAQTAEAIAAQYNVKHYPGHRYDPATNAYVPDTAPAPVAPVVAAAPIPPAAPAAPAAAWAQSTAPAAGATPPAPWAPAA